MKDKKNLIIGILVVFLLAAVGFICYDKFFKKDEGNKPSIKEEDKVKLNDELSNVSLFAKNSDLSLVAVTKDGKEIIIYEKKEDNDFYYDYDENEKIIYISTYDYNTKERNIGLIDLKKGNGNYNLEIIEKIDNDENYFDNGPCYIAKIDKNIYFGSRGIIKYNIETKTLDKLNIIADRRMIWYTKYKNNLVYQFNDDIYLLDTQSNNPSLLLKESSLGYVYNDNLIYYNDDEDTYYLYDFETKESHKIANKLGMEAMDKDFIVPFNNDLYSFGNTENSYLTIYKYNNKKIDEVYSFSCDDFKDNIKDCSKDILGQINTLSKVSDDSLLIWLGNEYEGYNYYIKFNVNTKKITFLKEEASVYLNEYYIK